MFAQYSKMVLLEAIKKNDQNGTVSLSRAAFESLLVAAIGRYFDEEWYIRKYPDVGKALNRGGFVDGLGHYARYGYYENRFPYQIDVDPDFYLKQYPDVKAALDAGNFNTAQEHFDVFGFREGRIPVEGWTLWSEKAAGPPKAPGESDPVGTGTPTDVDKNIR